MNDTRHDGNDDPLERYLEEFGAGFVAATDAVTTAAPLRGRRRPRWKIAVPASVALAGVAVAVIAVLPGSSHHGLTAIDQANAALSPENAIVHMEVTYTVTEGPGVVTQKAEQWSTVDPTRWRLVQVNAPLKSGSVRDRFGQPIEGREEFSYAAGELRRLLVSRNVLDVASASSEDGPGLFGLPNRGDPADELRAAARSGKVVDDGEAEVDGQRVRRLVATTTTTRGERRLVYNVDPDSFAPISGTLTVIGTPRTTYAFRIDRYQRLKLTPENEQLLKIKTDADTEVRELP